MRPEGTSTVVQAPNQLKLDPSWLGTQVQTSRIKRLSALSIRERQFYALKIKEVFLQTDGPGFEREITRILRVAFDDFQNPDPYGKEGDWGCDGYTDAGRHIFACYCADQQRREPDSLSTKVKRDLSRALEKWHSMEEWTFITNAKTSASFMRNTWETLKASHGPKSNEPLTMTLWKEQDISELVFNLSDEDIDRLYPGMESVRDFQLADFMDVLEGFVNGTCSVHNHEDIHEVSCHKMEYNQIDEEYQSFLKKGIETAPIIDFLFTSHPDPSYRDSVAQRFTDNYIELRKTGADSDCILEGLFTRVGGSDFRSRGKTRRMSTYAAVSYFFQTCDIFENAPDGWSKDGGDTA